MENIKKLKFVSAFRKFTDSCVAFLPLPNVNPDIVSLMSLILSAVFLFFDNILVQIIILIFVLILDWMDGLIARKYNFRKNEKEEEKGWMVDVIIDRLSEGVIFILYFNPWFWLFILNSILSLVSYKIRKHLSLPLRQAFLVWLVTSMLM